MASVSYGLNRGQSSTQPEAINVGTQAVSTYDIELRWDNTKALNTDDIILTLQSFIRRLEDAKYGPTDTKHI